jgi:hypothetical protein
MGSSISSSSMFILSRWRESAYPLAFNRAVQAKFGMYLVASALAVAFQAGHFEQPAGYGYFTLPEGAF